MSPVSYAAAEKALVSRLSAGAFAHSTRVAQAAAELAQRVGVDAELARMAGLLHDWNREVPWEDLMSAAVAAGVEVTEADAAVPYLLHARTGALALREMFPALQAEVVSAVARHTVGSAEMTDLDKVVYIADMIEPGRVYDGVESLRRLARAEPLDELFAAAYQQSITYLITSRKRIHPQTVAVWNALIAGGRDE